jgi:hypothetical protein
VLEREGCVEAAEYEVAEEYGSNVGCGNVPLDNLASYKIDEAEDKSDSAGLTDSTAVNTNEKLENRGSTACRSLSTLIKSCKRSCTCDELGSRNSLSEEAEIEKGSNGNRTADRSEGEKHEYMSRDSGVYNVLAKSAKETLNDYDSEDRTESALPEGHVYAEVKSEKKTGNYSGEIADGLLFASDEVEKNLCNNRTCNAGKNYPKSLETEDDHACNGCGEKSDNNVTHDVAS